MLLHGVRGALALCLVPALGLGCAPQRGDDDDSATPFRIIVETEFQVVAANVQDSAQVSIRVEGASPETVFVRAASPGWLTAEAGDAGVAEGRWVEARVHNGHASVLLSCQDEDRLPREGAGWLTVSAHVGDLTYESEVWRFACAAVQDMGGLTFLSPGAGETVRGWPRQEVTLSVHEHTGFTADGAVVVTPGNATVQLAAMADSAPEVAGAPLTVDVMGGSAQFYVLYPGDTALAAGPLSLTFTAAFRCTLGDTHQAQHTFRYQTAPNDSAIRYVDVAPVLSNDPNVRITATTPPAVTLTAGSVASGNSVRFTVEVLDRLGHMPPPGTPVSFTCMLTGATTEIHDCQGLTLHPPGSTSGSPVANQVEGFLPCAMDPANGQHGDRCVAEVVYTPHAQSTAGTVSIQASFTPEGSPTVVTTAAQSAQITLGSAP